ncbi:protein of unknown function [Burkholderia multivorans]
MTRVTSRCSCQVGPGAGRDGRRREWRTLRAPVIDRPVAVGFVDRVGFPLLRAIVHCRGQA